MCFFNLFQDSIAKIPLVVYISGFLSTFLTKPLNKCYGRKVLSTYMYNCKFYVFMAGYVGGEITNGQIYM